MGFNVLLNVGHCSDIASTVKLILIQICCKCYLCVMSNFSKAISEVGLWVLSVAVETDFIIPSFDRLGPIRET